MNIFNVQIFGSDADYFMALDCDAKKEWIKSNTNQKDDGLIDTFVKAVRRGSDEECQGCKDKKKNNGITATVSEKTSTAVKPSGSAKNSGKGSAEEAE